MKYLLLSTVILFTACTASPERRAALIAAARASITPVNASGFDPVNLSDAQRGVLQAGCTVAAIWAPLLTDDVSPEDLASLQEACAVLDQAAA